MTAPSAIPAFLSAPCCKFTSRFHGSSLCPVKDPRRLCVRGTYRRSVVSATVGDEPVVHVSVTPEKSSIATLSDVHEIIALAKEFELADFRLEDNGVVIELSMPGGRGFKDGKLQDLPPPPVEATSFAPPSQPYEYVASSSEGEEQGSFIPNSEDEALDEDPVNITAIETRESEQADENGAFPSDFYVTSNRVGFYHSGGKGKPPLVNVDDHVKFNQPVCIIEQLGQQYVYLSEVSGTVVKVFVEDGDPVEYGSKVMLIRPD